MITKIKRKYRQVTSAMQAGLVVSKCQTGCRLDDENQEVIACLFHEDHIKRLAKINEENS